MIASTTYREPQFLKVMGSMAEHEEQTVIDTKKQKMKPPV